MKIKFTVDVHVDVSTMAESEKPKIRWRQVNNGHGGKKLEAFFPAGTEYECDGAAFLVDRGMGIPADAECQAAARPMSEAERSKLQLEYQADQAGIVNPEDRELFFAGVIVGYEQVKGRTAYLPGPNYRAWKDAMEAAANAPAETS